MTMQCACPSVYPDWHEQDIDLTGTLVHVIKIPCFLFMPLSYDTYVARQTGDIESLELKEKWQGFTLTRTALLRGEILRPLEPASSPSRFVKTMDGRSTFRGYLHQGGIGTVKESIRKLQNQLFDLGRMPGEMYLSYLTCPACSEKKGGDKILLLRKWKTSKTLTNRIQQQRGK